MPPRSKVWLHFSKIDGSSARRNICKKDIVAKAGNTTNFDEASELYKVYRDNAANMDVAVKKMSIRKIGCFAYTPKCGVWLKMCSLAKPVLKEKQRLLGLPEHAVILDVSDGGVISGAVHYHPGSLDGPLVKKINGVGQTGDELSDEDYSKAEQFVTVMKILYNHLHLC
ncbi:hypothetical protein ABVT39_016326 [Epinephelus coioides]